MNIVIRADAGFSIGLGHVMRCLAIADGLKKRGATVTFICRQETGNLIGYLTAIGHNVRIISGGISLITDLTSTIEILQRLNSPPDWMIVDHYGLDITWETPVRKWVKKILVVDDLENRKHDCDILLDQNYRGVDSFTRYTELVPPACIKLLGPKYALLRSQFQKIREAVHDRNTDIHSLLIFMGGSDTANVTCKVLNAVKKLNRPDMETHVIIGSANPHRELIESLASTLENTICHFAVENVAELIASSDLCIGGAGIAMWERCCLGLPTLVISVANNQKSGAVELSKQGCIFYSGWHENVTDSTLFEDLSFLLRHPEIVSAASLRAREFVDGKGVDRVIQYIEQASAYLQLRRARKDDCRFVYELRSQPEVIKNSFNQTEINWGQHVDWFADLLKSSSRVLLIAENELGPIGLIRYDMQGEDAEISIALTALYRGSGIGMRILEMGNKWIMRERPKVKKVFASIKRENLSSKRMFYKSGFIEDYSIYTLNLTNYQK